MINWGEGADFCFCVSYVEGKAITIHVAEMAG